MLIYILLSILHGTLTRQTFIYGTLLPIVVFLQPILKKGEKKSPRPYFSKEKEGESYFSK